MKYRIKDYKVGIFPTTETPITAYCVQMKLWYGWVAIRMFVDFDEEENYPGGGYARRCAEELYDKLTEVI